jgi:regulator of protease activity HflC (stomatin/prohibitin superfamily)
MSLANVLRALLAIVQWVWHLAYRHALDNPWAAAVAAYGLAVSFGVTIQSGQRGVLFRWGRVSKELEPGFHWLIPLVHAVKKTPVRSVTIDLPPQKVMTADGLVYDVSVNVVYRVAEATKALTLVDHVDAGCRAVIPLFVTEVVRVLDQSEVADRLTLDRRLAERINAWITRWGLVVEQAGFTTISPAKSVLHTTQLRAKTLERADTMRMLIEAGLDAGSALVMIGAEYHPAAKSSLRYHLRARRAMTHGTRVRARKARGADRAPTRPEV